ncbi:MAG TPA: HD domain-containing phosphohydrolase, partial [Gemmatimonadales bacterium]|nr:HD domain-containing phosphohydrolase [Gemmatimonadales bacterium]
GAAAADLLQRGADGVVHKPLEPELLVHAAAAALDRRSLSRAMNAMSAARNAGPVLQLLGEIVAAFEKADPYRAGFSARTARLSVAIGSALSLDTEKLALAARVHDVGMLAVPVTEQHANARPNRPAQHLIRVHPTLGARWVERLGADRTIVAAVAAHHERWDGGGYPGGLAGADIPPEARVLGTAAAIAAMASSRPWREKRDIEEVLAQLTQGSGSQFPPQEAAAAAEVLRKIPTILG